MGPLASCGPKSRDDCVPLGVVLDTAGAAPATSDFVDQVLDHILADNPQVERSSVRYYTDGDALTDDLLARPTSLVAAVHFSTRPGVRRSVQQDRPVRLRWLPLQRAVA